MSSIYKPYQVRTVNNPAKISNRPIPTENGEVPIESVEPAETLDRETIARMIAEARQLADELVRQAHAEANEIKETAQTEIELWWQERRTEDEQVTENAQREGFERGYEDGVKLAEAEVRQQYEDVVVQAEQLVEQAFIVKNQIIAEAEPFLLELSTKIAEKVIQKQLTIEPSFQLDLIQNLLQRKREKGVITLCVSAEQFMFMNASREDLSRAIDAQAELHIIPDASVKDMGCMIRSALGTIDARIDTQLAEIKKALLTVLSADEDVEA